MTDLPTTDFTYRNGALHAEDVPVARIAEAVGTPFYCYSSAGLERQYRAYASAFADQNAMICYATKANSNLAVIGTFARLGAGADVVSEGELRQALAAGVPPGRIVFSGVGKTRAEIAFALEHGIYQLNAESEPELIAIDEVARRLGTRAKVAIRVNPDVDARTHAKISTGKSENKFGIDIGTVADIFRRGAALPGLDLCGVAVHIGSQLTELQPYREAFGRLVELVRALRAEGFPVSRLDLGGGIGIRYRAEAPMTIEAYAAVVKEAVAGLDVSLTFEPGRRLVGEAGILVSSVIYVKHGSTRRFVIHDVAMNDLIRPSLYDAWHDIVPVRQPAPGAVVEPADIVGPICESGDTFAQQRPLPTVGEGDLLAILSAGAYGAVMSSTYNSRLLVPEVMVRGGEFAVIRPRPSYDDMLSLDRVPGWLANADRARGAA